MKKTSLLALMLVTFMAAPAFADSARNLAVSATVAANCTVSTATLNFGSYDSLVANAATDLAASQALTLKCTKGTAAASINLNPDANNSSGRRMRSITINF